MHEIAELRKNNPYFNDAISEKFERYAVKRSAEIATTYPQIKLKIIPNADKFKISKSLLYYLTNLTKIDVFDDETKEKYKKMFEEQEAKNIQELKEKSNLNNAIKK